MQELDNSLVHLKNPYSQHMGEKGELMLNEEYPHTLAKGFAKSKVEHKGEDNSDEGENKQKKVGT